MAGLHLYFYYGKNIPKLIKEGQKPSNILNTYVHYFSISVFSNYDHDSYDTDGQKVMRMGFGGENLVAIAELGGGGGGGHGHSHNPKFGFDIIHLEIFMCRAAERPHSLSTNSNDTEIFEPFFVAISFSIFSL